MVLGIWNAIHGMAKRVCDMRMDDETPKTELRFPDGPLAIGIEKVFFWFRKGWVMEKEEIDREIARVKEEIMTDADRWAIDLLWRAANTPLLLSEGEKRIIADMEKLLIAECKAIYLN